MKLRVARKILFNWRDNKCHYSAKTLARASWKYKPYLVKYCKEKNAELEAKGEMSLFYAPYILKTVTPLVGNTNVREKLLSTRYAKATAINRIFI